MATTSPDNIWTPDSGDDYALTVDLAATADTVQDALTSLRDEVEARPIVQAGSLETTNEPSTARQSISVTFPTPFSTVPVVVTAGAITGGGTPTWTYSPPSTTSTTGFTLFYSASTNFGSGNQAILNWMAFGEAV